MCAAPSPRRPVQSDAALAAAATYTITAVFAATLIVCGMACKESAVWTNRRNGSGQNERQGRRRCESAAVGDARPHTAGHEVVSGRPHALRRNTRAFHR